MTPAPDGTWSRFAQVLRSLALAAVSNQVKLTGGSEEEQHQDPVDPKEEEGQEGEEGLQGEEGEVDEDLPRHVEQGDGQRHPLPHEEHEQQQDHLQATAGSAAGSSVQVWTSEDTVLP